MILRAPDVPAEAAPPGSVLANGQRQRTIHLQGRRVHAAVELLIIGLSIDRISGFAAWVGNVLGVNI
ncbi:copper resistance protein Crd2 [Coccidioides immitis RS]|uniref:Copper resistance protein Crd2 n=1 Tax=Coccidioides immitis (strain RS) TaxID=246410 RepID=A0A0E1RVH2_COCIM|nr:copper resistance protein Crd2 [Coccidioides immitis RS]EAS29891.2 copper resistance protein Crd2 [Coccidioides immitis RS]